MEYFSLQFYCLVYFSYSCRYLTKSRQCDVMLRYFQPSSNEKKNGSM